VTRREPSSRTPSATINPRIDTYAATPRTGANGINDVSPSRVATSRVDSSIRQGTSTPNTNTSSRAAARVPSSALASSTDARSGQRTAVTRPGGTHAPDSRYAVPRTTHVVNDWHHDHPYYPERSHHYHSYYVAPTHFYYYPGYYYYPHYLYPYGYGAFGLGYFYYDPYAWAPVASIHYDGSSYGYGYGNPTGSLRLQVRPRDAEVYVDGYYAGMVDEFDGTYQSLSLEEGEYHIEIVAAGYETIAFDVRIQPGRSINYRGDMFPAQQP
jgi:hypothetical protein